MKLLGRLFGSRPEPPVPRGDPQRVAQVQAALEELRPLLRLDGGDVQLVAVGEGGDVELALVGACRSCAVRALTLQGAVEPHLRRKLDWVRRVHD